MTYSFFGEGAWEKREQSNKCKELKKYLQRKKLPNCCGYESFSGGLAKSAILAMLMPHLKVGAQKWTATIKINKKKV